MPAGRVLPIVASLTLCLSGCALSAVADDGSLPVFPGAQGFGSRTPAGRGGRVVHVTNLNGAGPGSLRACVGESGPRVCVFDVSGTIRTNRRISIEHPYVTVAGQTAPSPGITIRGAGLYVSTHHVLVQHLRIRVGDDPDGPPPDTRDGVAIHSKASPAHHVVLDHLSVSWAIDENVEVWYGSRDVTLNHCIISEALQSSLHSKGPHAFGVLIGSSSGDVSMIGNLLALNDRRNPRVTGASRVFFANNLVYGWRGASGELGDDRGPLVAAVVGNVYIRNSGTEARTKPVTLSKHLPAGGRVFVEDNVDGDPPEDPWSVVWVRTRHSIKSDSAPLWPEGFIARRASAVSAHVLANSGARPVERDAVDARIIANVRNKTGRIIDSQDEVGGWPRLPEHRERFQVPPDPNGDADGDGYTNLEERLHELARQLAPGP